MLGSIDPVFAIQLGLPVLAIAGSTVSWIRRRRRRAAVLRSERPGALIYERPPRRRSTPGRVTGHRGHLVVYDSVLDAHVTLSAAGLEARCVTASAMLSWDRFREGIAPQPGTWIARVEMVDADIVSMVVAWGRGAPAQPEAGGPREVSIPGRWDDGDWACFSALVRVLVHRPDLRRALDDSVAVEHLTHDIGAFDPMLPAQRFGSVRRHVVEIETAMKRAGFVHAYGRPLPDWAIPSLEDAVVGVREGLSANPYAHNITITDEEIVEHLRLDYLDIDPWPFHALVDL